MRCRGEHYPQFARVGHTDACGQQVRSRRCPNASGQGSEEAVRCADRHSAVLWKLGDDGGCRLEVGLNIGHQGQLLLLGEVLGINLRKLVSMQFVPVHSQVAQKVDLLKSRSQPPGTVLQPRPLLGIVGHTVEEHVQAHETDDLC